MSKKILALVIVIIAVAAISLLIFKKDVKRDTMKSSQTQTIQQDVKADKSSAEYKQFAGLKGDEYDRLFLSNMIAHHQGAVDMANLVLTYATHTEIKTLAQSIVSTQTSEITNMVSWQKNWGYPATSGAAMMEHSAMGMESTNATMMESLQGKKGEEFDKAFLEQMIMHHQSSINMATTGITNAQHQEVKDLTVAIIAAQSKEIQQMKQWQKYWDYEKLK